MMSGLFRPLVARGTRRVSVGRGMGVLNSIACSARCFTSGSAAASPLDGAPLTPRAAFKILGFKRHLHETRDDAARRVKRCFIEATLQCHPDLFPNDATATQRFQTLSDALRVALTFAATKANGGVDDDANGEGLAPTQGTAAAFSTLQRAVEAHQAMEAHGSRSMSTTRNVSLEDVTSICRSETLAGARLRTLVDELPAVLCGKEVQLFEVFCFHPPRFSQRMAAFALRFSKDLPVIVRRVVKRRPQAIRKHHHSGFKNAAAFGAGSGDGARDKTIEEMIMKPLVLVGALLFVESQRVAYKWNLALDRTEGAGGLQGHDSGRAAPEAADRQDGDDDEDAVVAAGKPMVTRGTDVHCSAELRCVLYDTDPLPTIVEKISAWEARSFQRLQLELAVGRALSVLSSMLHLVPGTTALALSHDLSIPFDKAQSVAYTAQHLVCALCLCADVDAALVGADGAATHAAVNARVVSIRHRAETLDAEAIKGGIQLLMPKTQDEWASLLVHGLHGVTPVPSAGSPSSQDDPPPPGAATNDGEPTASGAHDDTTTSSQQATDGDEAHRSTSPPSPPPPTGASTRCHVARHPSACEATDLLFCISIPLQKDIVAFLTTIDEALQRVEGLYHSATEVLPQLVQWRDQVVGDELIPIDGTVPGGAATDDANGKGTAQDVAGAADGTKHDEALAATDVGVEQLRVEEDVVVGNGTHGCEANLWDTELPWARDGEDATRPSTATLLNAPLSGGAAQRHIRRDGIRCVARVFNMLAADECVLWARLYEHRRYLAEHQRLISASLNIFFDCLPYDPTTAGATGSGAAGHRSERQQEDASRRDTLGHHGGGWCGEARDGGDLVVLTHDELSDSSAFLHWLQEVVEQSSMAKECARRLREEGIEYMEREPSLPLSHYLSFIALYTSPSGAAARSLVEAAAAAGRAPNRPRTAATAAAAQGKQHRTHHIAGRAPLSVDDVGFGIVVSCSTCDIRDGGRLFVPWYFDPSHLVAVLEDADRQTRTGPPVMLGG